MMRGLTRPAARGRGLKNGPGSPPVPQLWLITFADLSTLILSFFVLLFSMSSIESGLIERISSSLRDNPSARIRGLGRLDSKYEELMQLMADSDKLEQNQEEIKNLLFEQDVLPSDADRGMITNNIAVLSREDGTGIVFSADLLFAPGSNAVSWQGLALLDAISPLLSAVPYDIMISGHSDDKASTAESREDLYHNSGARALAVLERFLSHRADGRRFSAAGYGLDKPLEGLGVMDTDEKGQGRVTDRRIEIIIKNRGASNVSS
jgi:chemotaxis protein MotB